VPNPIRSASLRLRAFALNLSVPIRTKPEVSGIHPAQKSARQLAIWNLELLWLLELGAWGFVRSFRPRFNYLTI